MRGVRYLCAEAARGRGDTLIGSAGPATAWVLLECPGAWPREIADLPMLAGDPAAQTLFRTAAHTSGRVLAIRRPRTRRPAPSGPDGGRTDSAGSAYGSASDSVADSVTGSGSSPRLAVVSQRFELVWWSSWQSSDDLLAAAGLLTRVQQAATTDDLGPTTGWQASDHELLLVCAHAKHDPCCAIRGRAVAAALADRWPEATWESSHLGGDRFAGNLLVVPRGFLYGNLDGADAIDCVLAVASTRPELTHLRGISGFSPHAQAALAELLAGRPRLGLADLAVAGITRDGPNAWTVLVRIHPDDGEVRVRVLAERGEAALLTCHAAAAAPPLHLSATVLP